MTFLIRESDRQNYTSHGYRALTSYAFAKDIIPEEFADRFASVDQVRRAVVDKLTSERLPTGRRVTLALAAAWSGQHDIAENTASPLAAELEAPAIERLRELQSHRP